MKMKKLGQTKYEVSEISLGTVALGMEYGISEKGVKQIKERKEAIKIIHHALFCGINFFDTAPSYGDSEKIIGEALKGRQKEVVIATKINIPLDNQGNVLVGKKLKESIENSLKASCLALKCQEIQILKIHNATEELIEKSDVLDYLLQMQKKGYFSFLGASVYGEENALAIVQKGCFNVLQVAYNILDQSMQKKVFSLAKKENVAIVTRSALLKGALSYRVNYLPENLNALRQIILKMCADLKIDLQDLPQIALSFCWENKDITSVLIGASSVDELENNLNALQKKSFYSELYQELLQRGINEEALTNPSFWGI